MRKKTLTEWDMEKNHTSLNMTTMVCLPNIRMKPLT